jgi:hypothetical protein
VLELHFQTTAELVEIDLRPIDAEFAANPLGRGGTYPLFFGFRGCVLSVFDWVSLLHQLELTRTPGPVEPRLERALGLVLGAETLIVVKILISGIQFCP